MELWKVIEGFCFHEISNEGRVRSNRQGKLQYLTPYFNKKRGYFFISICKEGKRKNFLLHRLVAKHFVENDNLIEKKEVDHLDFNRQNNKSINLEWVSKKENLKRVSKRAISAIKPTGFFRHKRHRKLVLAHSLPPILEIVTSLTTKNVQPVPTLLTPHVMIVSTPDAISSKAISNVVKILNPESVVLIGNFSSDHTIFLNTFCLPVFSLISCLRF